MTYTSLNVGLFNFWLCALFVVFYCCWYLSILYCGHVEFSKYLSFPVFVESYFVYQYVADFEESPMAAEKNVFCHCLLDLCDLWCHSIPVFLYFSFWEWGSEAIHDRRVVILWFYIQQYSFCETGCACIWHIYVQNCNLLLMNCSIYEYKVNFFIYTHYFWLEVFLVRYWNR